MESNHNHKIEAQEKRVLIRVEFMRKIQFCGIRLTKLTRQSFLSDGELRVYSCNSIEKSFDM